MKKRSMLLLVLLLVIGFAAVSTTLILNGTIGVGVDTNFEDDVIFTYADLGENGKAEIINQGKAITFTTKEILDIGSIIPLNFKISNKNKQYDAIAKIECTVNEGYEELLEYISVTPNKLEYEINASSTVVGELSIKYEKGYLGTEENNKATMEVTCKLNVGAREKETLENEITILHKSEDVEYINEELEITNIKEALDYIYGRMSE